MGSRIRLVDLGAGYDVKANDRGRLIGTSPAEGGATHIVVWTVG